MSHEDTTCMHMMLLATLLDHASLAVASAAAAAFASCLSPANHVKQGRLLLQLLPRLGAALRREGLTAAAAAGWPDAAPEIALAATLPLMLPSSDVDRNVRAAGSAFAPVAVAAARLAAAKAAAAPIAATAAEASLLEMAPAALLLAAAAVHSPEVVAPAEVSSPPADRLPEQCL